MAKKRRKKATRKKATRKKVTRKKATRKKVTKKKATRKKATRKKATKKKVTKKKATKKKKTKRKPNKAFMKPLKPSPALAAVVGSSAIPRTQVVKKLWAYIRRHNLQDKKNRRMVNADAKLKAVFKKNKVSMFEIAKIISKHLK